MIQFQSNVRIINTHATSSIMLAQYAIFGITALMLLTTVTDCSAEDDTNRDSYIDAYHDSRGGDIKSKSSERESKYSPLHDQVSGPDQHYEPSIAGYPPQYYPPSQYGPPPAYGPSNHASSYPMPFYGMPHAMLGLLDKFHLKLNIFTVLKVILKLVIFKKIVSFIALICLLLFIPKFKMDQDEDDTGADDGRSIKSTKAQIDARVNTLTQYVLGAIDKYSTNNVTCEGINCEVERNYRDIDNKYSYNRLLPMYVQEES